MARFSKYEVIGKILDTGLIPIFYEKDIEVAKKIVEACRNGGAHVVEFANRGKNAVQVFKHLEKWCCEKIPDLVLGAGTIIDPATAALYIDSGANFIVGPVFNRDVAKVCNRHKIVYSPGCGTASEISEAEELGLDIIKVFPGGTVGPNFIRSLLEPSPWVKLMPTGGVQASRENINEWIKAGAACIGIGSDLIDKTMIESGNFEGIARKTERVLWWIKEARGTPLFLRIDRVAMLTSTDSSPEVRSWYSRLFGSELNQETGSTDGMDASKGTVYVARIMVSNFEEACKQLKNKGITLEKPKINDKTKTVFLKNPDPAGYRVQVFYKV